MNEIPCIGGVIFCYDRAARGRASRALKAAGITSVEYASSASLACWHDRKPTPRYLFNSASQEQIDTLVAALEKDGDRTELYYERR